MKDAYLEHTLSQPRGLLGVKLKGAERRLREASEETWLQTTLGSAEGADQRAALASKILSGWENYIGHSGIIGPGRLWKKCQKVVFPPFHSLRFILLVEETCQNETWLIASGCSALQKFCVLCEDFKQLEGMGENWFLGIILFVIMTSYKNQRSPLCHGSFWVPAGFGFIEGQMKQASFRVRFLDVSLCNLCFTVMNNS